MFRKTQVWELGNQFRLFTTFVILSTKHKGWIKPHQNVVFILFLIFNEFWVRIDYWSAKNRQRSFFPFANWKTTANEVHFPFVSRFTLCCSRFTASTFLKWRIELNHFCNFNGIWNIRPNVTPLTCQKLYTYYTALTIFWFCDRIDVQEILGTCGSYVSLLSGEHWKLVTCVNWLHGIVNMSSCQLLHFLSIDLIDR